MSSNLRRQIEEVLAPLIGSGRLALTHEQPYGKEDAVVVLESPTLRIRVIRDRGDTAVEFAPVFQRDSWVSSYFVVPLLDSKQTYPCASDASNHFRIDSLADFFEENLAQLELLFSPSIFSDTRRRVAELQAENARRVFGFTGTLPTT
jgi:hypothetical protein